MRSRCSNGAITTSRRDAEKLTDHAGWGARGMIGISYLAATQMEAAVERPPHLKAIIPTAGTFDR